MRNSKVKIRQGKIFIHTVCNTLIKNGCDFRSIGQNNMDFYHYFISIDFSHLYLIKATPGVNKKCHPSLEPIKKVDRTNQPKKVSLPAGHKLIAKLPFKGISGNTRVTKAK